MLENISHIEIELFKFILFENQIQTKSASPCCTQVLSVASFLVCFLIFIEYYSYGSYLWHNNIDLGVIAKILGSIIFVVGKSTIDIMEPILL